MGWSDRWFVRFTRFGTSHLVRAQEGVNACGMACSMMACCRMNKWTTVAEGMVVEQDVYKKVDALQHKATGTNTGAVGIWPYEVAALLNTLNIGLWDDDDVGQANVGDAIIDAANYFQLTTMPIIAVVQWNSSSASHYVLIDNVFNLLGTYYACVNDPWDGDVHIVGFKKGQKLPYEAKDPVFSVDFWGSRYKYTGGTGYFDGRIVRCLGMDNRARLGKVFLSGNPL